MVTQEEVRQYHEDEEHEEVNVTRVPKKPAPAVQPGDEETNGKGGG